MADDEAKKAKQAEIDRKRAEVRKRMEEASKAKKAKKGFMTPDRKKKLRLLLRKKAAEELKKEQERKAAERRRIIEERCGQPKNIDDAGEDTIKRVIKEYYDRITKLEDQKFDLEYVVKKKDFEISELNSQVNDLRGKFVKPTLKKVSKYENKFAKLQKKAAEFNFRNQLKVVKKKEFTLEEEDKEKKPDWSKKGDEKKGEGEDGDGTEDEKTDDGLTTEGESNAGDMTDATEDAQSDNEIIEPEPVVEPEPEPQPPSPAPEELWAYLKDTVCSNNPLSVDDLVDKLMTAVTAIPQPLLNSVVKDTIKKQKSIDEGLEGGPPAEGDPDAPADPSAAPADPSATPADPSATPADPSATPADPSATPADQTIETAVPTDPATEAAPTDPATAAAEPADPTTAAAAEVQPAPPAEGEQPAATEEVKPAEAPAAEATPEAAPAAAESVPEPAATA
ncbi:troponin I 2 isoform X1 [Rhopalosiphum maidis]|uniref:troponin I 2 isoform X1 n=1 Tax=Rhopalosiphum maidis TaxID=43146 RepID=UPI000EFE86ED|nr:troponin I 2 isoform X1 [Rhopalosiphum maidis]